MKRKPQPGQVWRMDNEPGDSHDRLVLGVAGSEVVVECACGAATEGYEVEDFTHDFVKVTQDRRVTGNLGSQS